MTFESGFKIFEDVKKIDETTAISVEQYSGEKCN